jgi:hypothetical protein
LPDRQPGAVANHIQPLSRHQYNREPSGFIVADQRDWRDYGSYGSAQNLQPSQTSQL